MIFTNEYGFKQREVGDLVTVAHDMSNKTYRVTNDREDRSYALGSTSAMARMAGQQFHIRSVTLEGQGAPVYTLDGDGWNWIESMLEPDDIELDFGDVPVVTKKEFTSFYSGFFKSPVKGETKNV